MLDEEWEELYLLRFVVDPVKGLRLEDCTRRELEFQLEEYCGVILAHQLMAGRLRKWTASLQEFDESVNVNVLVDRSYAGQLASYLAMVNRYFYTPYGHDASG